MTASEPSLDPAQWFAGNERRRSRRVPLHWTIYLACNGAGHPLRSSTRDISSDGFFCFLNHPVKTGDQFECEIVIPTHISRDPRDVAYLRCHAQVVRVEQPVDGSELGLGCRIEDYCLVHGPNVGPWITRPVPD
ncbi:MAG TPA: PilZ domain-containing protein [Bryobacteraceae bacterium]|nr:PilZ domain-containing protein [Bryobacteraceae bacterium]